MTYDRLDFSISKSLEFIEANTELAGSTLLEVGAGKGELAEALTQRGASVLALDISDSNVETMQAKGVNAKVADFLRYDHSAQFDIVVFRYSLHHIHPLNEAVENAYRLLKDTGVLIVEEFGAELADEPTLTWLNKQLAQIKRAYPDHDQSGRDGHAHAHEQHPAQTKASKTDSLQAWQQHHFQHHFISNSQKLRQSLSERFAMTPPIMVPSMYRYAADAIPLNIKERPELVANIFTEEHDAIIRGEMVAIGFFTVGRKKVSS